MWTLTCDVVHVWEEGLKHFHTSLLGNEEDAKGLLNIKQEFLSHYLLQWFHLKRGGLVMNDYWLCWFLHTMLYKQTHLAPISYKDSSLKVLINFQVWARFSSRSMYFFVFVFSYLPYECVPCHAGQYQTLSTSGTGTLLWLHKLATKILQLVAKRWPNNFFNFKPCLTNKILITMSWPFFCSKAFWG